jgi:single-strand DNA-binding protein
MLILKMGVAVNDRRKNQQSGEWEDVPNFLDVTVFGTRAEALTRYLSKGSKVAVEGKLRWSQWEKDGVKRSKVEIIADEVGPSLKWATTTVERSTKSTAATSSRTPDSSSEPF